VDKQEGAVVVHTHDLGFDGIEGVWGTAQSVSVVFNEILEVKSTVCFEKVEEGKKSRYKAASHSLALWRKFSPLFFRVSEEQLLGHPFAYEIGQFSSDMKAMPDAAKIMEVERNTGRRRVKALRISRNVVVKMVTGDGGLVQRD